MMDTINVTIYEKTSQVPLIEYIFAFHKYKLYSFIKIVSNCSRFFALFVVICQTGKLKSVCHSYPNALTP